MIEWIKSNWILLSVLIAALMVIKLVFWWYRKKPILFSSSNHQAPATTTKEEVIDAGKDRDKAINEKFDKAQKDWAEKFNNGAKSILILFALAGFVSCSSSRPILSTGNPEPWVRFQNACMMGDDPGNGAGMVMCEKRQFQIAGQECIELGRRLELCKSQWDVECSVADIDLQNCRAKVDDLSATWRNPWLWGVVGLLVGGGVGIGIGLGK